MSNFVENTTRLNDPIVLKSRIVDSARVVAMCTIITELMSNTNENTNDIFSFEE